MAYDNIPSEETFRHLYLEQGLPMRQIAETYGLPTHVLKHWKKRWGVPTRRLSQSFVGRTSGLLTVVDEKMGETARVSKVICKCSCGNTYTCNRAYFRQRQPQSCGCQGRIYPLRKTVEDMQALAKTKGGEFLSPEYKGLEIKHLWQCAHGHQWEAIPHSIQQGSWCPKCHTSTGEQLCRKVFNTLFQVPFRSVFPSWLVNHATGRRLQIDGYNKNLKLAFEYQGRQHYRYVPKYHRTQERFKALQERDTLKTHVCEDRGITLVAIHYDRTRLRGFTFTPKRRAEAYKDKVLRALKETGYTLVSDEILSSHTRVALECPEGHQWEEIAKRVTGDKARCPECHEQDKREHFTERVHTLVRDLGYEVLNQGPLFSQTPVHMRCPEGHEWKRVASMILYQGTKCARCEEEAHRKEYRERVVRALENMGYTADVPEEVKWDTRILCRCPEGHIWSRTANRVLRNPSCYACPREPYRTSSSIR